MPAAALVDELDDYDDESVVLVADFGTAHTRLGFADGEPRSFPSMARRACDRAGWQPLGPSEILPQGAGFSPYTPPSVALGEGEEDQYAPGGGVARSKCASPCHKPARSHRPSGPGRKPRHGEAAAARQCVPKVTVCTAAEPPGDMLVPALHRGVVTDWDAAEAVWRAAFEAVAGTERLAEHPVLISEPPLNPVANRERLLSMLFGFGVPAIHVLDIGHGVTSVLPVFKGYLLAHAVARLDVAGEALTAYLIRLLTERGHYLSERVEHLQLAQRIKEELCYVAPDADSAWPDCDEASYELPDGGELTLGSERFRCVEPLFRPSLLGKEVAGVHQLVRDCIEACAVDTRRELYGAIILSGGSARARGMAERLTAELTALVTDASLSGESSESYAPFNSQAREAVAREAEYSEWGGTPAQAESGPQHRCPTPSLPYLKARGAPSGHPSPVTLSYTAAGHCEHVERAVAGVPHSAAAASLGRLSSLLASC